MTAASSASSGHVPVHIGLGESRSAGAGPAPSAGRSPEQKCHREARLGVIIPADIPAASLVAYVRRAEQVGFHEVWVVEDCFVRGAFAQAATVLASTSSLGVGLGIIPAGARNVVFAAMEIASLAELYPGRLTVGIGHGIPSWLDQVGAWPRSPLTLLDEYIHVLRRLIAGQTVDFDGRYLRLRDAHLVHVPSVVPPVLAGVRGDKSLQLSGRVAQGTILAEPVTPEYLAFALNQIGAPDHEIVAYNIASVDADPHTARDRVRGPLAVVGEPDWAPQAAVLDFAAELADLRRRTGSAAAFAAALPSTWVDRLAIVGSVDTAREKLLVLRNAGTDRVVLIPAYPDLMSSLDSLAQLL